MNVEEKCQFILDQRDQGNYITRFGIVRLLQDKGHGFFQVESEIPNNRQLMSLEESELFPLNDHLIITIVRLTGASPFHHGIDTYSILSYGQFMNQDDALSAAGYQVPGQTHHVINLNNQGVTTSRLLPVYEQPVFVYITTWLDRVGPTDIAKFEDGHERDARIFNKNLAGCSEGIWMHLLLRLEWVEEDGVLRETSQLVDMEIYCGLLNLFGNI